jgi:predicted DNA-binding transcriptional regulator AlpA
MHENTFSPADILTPRELAARLKVSNNWVYNNMRPRRPRPLPVIKMGRLLRFHWPTIVAWLQSQQQGLPKAKAAR